ncbi:MAG: acyltransferase [Clostridia bacterium]|nr:acyltransferase [Clostridia bacterium]
MNNDTKSHTVLHYRTHLMGIAALWIYLFHEWIPLAPNVPVLGFTEDFIKQIGFFGVDIFFFLSGMGLTHAIEKYSLSVFYQRRFLRILPPYILTAIILMLANGWLFPQFLKHLFGVTFFTENIYALLWFVPAISIFYLLFPLYHFIFKKAGNKILFTGVMLMLWLTASLLAAKHMRLDLFGFTNRIPIFLVGILIGSLGKKGVPAFPKWIWVLLFGIFIAGLATAYQTNYKGLYLLVPVSNCCVPNFLMAFSGTFLFAEILKLCDTYGRKLGKIFLAVLRFFGTISFEFYCVQELVAEKIKHTLNGMFWDSITNAIMLVGVTVSALLLRFACFLLQKAGTYLFKKIALAKKHEP